MKKVLTFLISLLFSYGVLAQGCEVYGISDSPQKLDCTFSGKKVSLHCDGSNGAYTLGEEAVEVAYHEEVEDGPAPLLFKTSKKTLRVLIYTDQKISATLSEGPVTLNGSCRF